MTRHYAANDACDFYEIFEIAFFIVLPWQSFRFQKIFKKKSVNVDKVKSYSKHISITVHMKIVVVFNQRDKCFAMGV